MGVRFVIGRAGAGKTHLCLDEITSACVAEPLGPPLVYLVPEQSSYLSEKALLATGRCDGLTRAVVLSFTRLADYVFAQAPGPARPRLTANHRQLLATLLVSRKRRAESPGIFSHAGIEDAIADFLSEAKQYRANPARLGELIEKLADDRTPGREAIARRLGEKLAQLKAASEEYERLVAERFEDPQDSLATLYNLIHSGEFLQGARVHIDGFLGFTPIEEQVIAGLAARTTGLTICLLGDPARAQRLIRGEQLRMHPVYTTAEETLSRLLVLFRRNQIEIDEPRLLGTDAPPPRHAVAALRHIEANFLERRPEPMARTMDVQFWEADNPRQEARKAAEIIAGWRQEHGWRPGEMAVLVRDLDLYAPALEESFRVMRIPAFVDRSLPLETHPIVTGTQWLVRASLRPDNEEALIQLGKSGFLVIERDCIDRLEVYIRRYPRTTAEWFSPEPWPVPPPRSPFDEVDARADGGAHDPVVDETRRRLVEPLRALRQSWRIGERSIIPFGEFLRSLIAQVDAIVSGREWPDEDASILERMGTLLAEADEAIGGEEITWESAGDLSIRSLGQLSLPRIPPMLDHVFVGQVDRSRMPSLKGVVVPGLAEGAFPRPGANLTILNDAERDWLADLGFDVRPSSRRQFERESLFAYRAFTAASHAVAFTRPLARQDGPAAPPSVYWSELVRLFKPGDAMHVKPEDMPERCWRVRDLAASSLRRIDLSHLNGPAAVDKARSYIQDAFPGDREALLVLESALWRNEAQLSAHTLGDHVGHTLRTSVTRLESFGRCPFQHFVGAFLRPGEIMQPEFEARDAGLYCHATLSNVTRLLRERSWTGSALTNEQIRDIYVHASLGPRARIEATGLLSRASGRMLFDRLDEQLEDFVGWLVAAFAAVPLRPVAEEASFRPGSGEVVPLEIEGFLPGWKLVVTGQVDRIDTITVGGKEYSVVVDYKLSPRGFDFERWHHGENFQLPLYLLTITAERNGFPTPAGGLYAGIVAAKSPGGEEKPRAYRGVFRSSLLHSLLPDATWRSMPWIQGSNGDPDEQPRTWGTAISDVEFDALLRETESRLVDSARRICEGDIAVSPSRYGRATACAYCSFGAVCGIDYRLNRARNREILGRRGVLSRLRNGED